MNLQDISDFMEHQIPFNKLLGLKVLDLNAGNCTMLLPFNSNFIGDPVRKALHGGVISALIDTTGGLCCWSMVKNNNDRISTVDLRVDYLRKGPPENLICNATVVRMGNRVAVTRMEVYSQSNSEVIISTGQAVYNVSKVHR